MTRKKKAAPEAAQTSTATAAAVDQPMTGPAWIDGPPVDEQGRVIKSQPGGDKSQMELKPEPEHTKQWGPAYKAIYTAADFEMGEDRRWKQRVFKFREKPDEQVLVALKEAGFTYRANEKAWTIQANAATRTLADNLAREFSGQIQGMAR